MLRNLKKHSVIALVFLITSCMQNSNLYNMYSTFWLDRTTIVLNKDIQWFSLSGVFGGCNGDYVWSAKHDTLRLVVKHSYYEDHIGMQADSINNFAIVYERHDDLLIDITSKCNPSPAYDSLVYHGVIPARGLFKVEVNSSKNEKQWLRFGADIR